MFIALHDFISPLPPGSNVDSERPILFNKIWTSSQLTLLCKGGGGGGAGVQSYG